MRPLLVLGLITAGCAAPQVAEPPTRSASGGIEVGELGGLGLFQDEQWQAQALFAQALRARGLTVVDPEVTRRAWALTADGKDPRTGQACGRALPPWSARQRWGSTLGVQGVANAYAWCGTDGGCELSVSFEALNAAPVPSRLRAPLPASGAPLAVLPQVLAALNPPEPSSGGGDLLGGLGMRTPIQTDDQLRIDVSAADHRDRTRLTDDQERASFPGLTVAHLSTCLSAGESSASLLFEVSPAGQLGRCEGPYPSGPEVSCACGQLQRVGLAPWLSGRRWQTTLSIDRRDQVTRDGRLRLTGYWRTTFQRPKQPGEQFPKFEPHVEDPSIGQWRPSEARLATECFVDAFPEPGQLNSRWAVWFDGDGRATKVVEQKGFPPLPAPLSACVQRALKTAQAPCPARPGLWAMASLHVSASDPNAPPKNPFAK